MANVATMENFLDVISNYFDQDISKEKALVFIKDSELIQCILNICNGADSEVAVRCLKFLNEIAEAAGDGRLLLGKINGFALALKEMKNRHSSSVNICLLCDVLCKRCCPYRKKTRLAKIIFENPLYEEEEENLKMELLNINGIISVAFNEALTVCNIVLRRNVPGEEFFAIKSNEMELSSPKYIESPERTEAGPYAVISKDCLDKYQHKSEGLLTGFFSFCRTLW
ncbi:hypothetical protein Tsp_13228 [Trichinella spiralis]|uniref:hypothetical protein n=1 Tax=Trichinella spiralis TaxID=6334 RepID=UPI0001EFE3F9|nr:hypothetical protein Tsp_13228 [Trichinella spiralis]